jgi:excisionase family DNA binding protein
MPSQAKSPSDYLSKTEVARRLDISRRTVDRHIRSGALPAVAISPCCTRILQADFEAFLRSRPRRVTGSPAAEATQEGRA